jgi:holin-like protein
MKYVLQFGIIMLFSLAGDLCHVLLPFPIPASIYGMVLLFAALALKLLKVESVKETGAFLVSLLPLLFVIPTVGLMAYWDLIRADVFQIAILIVVTTILTFGVSGMLTKVFRKGGDDNG